ncbi:MAG: 2OG-Fe(II) oxygenase [Phycisphaeraceae bacterium]|nr:2OG-Fe(II) oxygenase [Phycisphaeraceae bacterium]
MHRLVASPSVEVLQPPAEQAELVGATLRRMVGRVDWGVGGVRRSPSDPYYADPQARDQYVLPASNWTPEERAVFETFIFGGLARELADALCRIGNDGGYRVAQQEAQVTLPGGHFRWHQDRRYPAVSVIVYGSACDGGELEVVSGGGGVRLVVPPREGFVVVMDARTLHRARPVSGDRPKLAVLTVVEPVRSPQESTYGQEAPYQNDPA